MTDTSEFADAQTEGNNFERNLLLILLDGSGSMADVAPDASGSTEHGVTKMDSLREGVVAFLNEDLPAIPAIRQRGEIAIGIFWGSGLEWVTPGRGSSTPFVVYTPAMRAPELATRARSYTPMATAIDLGLDAIAGRKQQLDDEDLTIEFKPMMFLITDGVPEPQAELDAIEGTIGRLSTQAFPPQRSDRKLLFFAFGVTGADEALMTRLAPPSYFSLDDTPLRHAMQFVSKAVGRITQAHGVGRDDYVAAREEVERARQELQDAYGRWGSA
jgi:uncharacterized protein YegL